MRISEGRFIWWTIFSRRITIALTVLLAVSCESAEQNQKTITLKSGKAVEVFFKIDEAAESEPILAVDCKTNEVIVAEKDVEYDVLEIWEAVGSEADKIGLTEGIIRYRFFSGEKSDDGIPIYTGLLFTAEKTENGRWKIDKIF